MRRGKKEELAGEDTRILLCSQLPSFVLLEPLRLGWRRSLQVVLDYWLIGGSKSCWRATIKSPEWQAIRDLMTLWLLRAVARGSFVPSSVGQCKTSYWPLRLLPSFGSGLLDNMMWSHLPKNSIEKKKYQYFLFRKLKPITAAKRLLQRGSVGPNILLTTYLAV